MWNSGTSVRHFLFLGYPSLTSSLLNVMPLKMNKHMKLKYIYKFYKIFLSSLSQGSLHQNQEIIPNDLKEKNYPCQSNYE